jgi:hypothetical protein
MTLELGGGILFQFPFRYAANAANALEPFVPEPAGGAAVSGVIDNECLVTVGGDFGLITQCVNGFYSVQNTLPRRPQLYFINESKKLDALAVKSFGRLFCFFCGSHSFISI